MATVPVVWSELDPLFFQDVQGNLALDINENAVRASIDNILGTSPGERIFLPTFASGIKQILFEPMNTNKLNAMTNSIKTSVETWDNRVTVQNVSLVINTDSNYVAITVSFNIVGVTQLLTTTTTISA